MTVCGLEDVNSGTLLAASLSGEWAVALSCGPAAELMPFSPAACNVTARSANAVSDPFTVGGIGLRENERAPFFTNTVDRDLQQRNMTAEPRFRIPGAPLGATVMTLKCEWDPRSCSQHICKRKLETARSLFTRAFSDKSEE